MLESIFQMVAPHHCVICNARGSVLCANCVHAELIDAHSSCFRCNRITDEFKTCRSCRSSSPIFRLYKVSLYEEPIKSQIVFTKFASARQGATELGRLIAVRLPRDAYDCVTFIPTEPQRVRQRGFDHALLMARAVAVELDIPLLNALNRLKRVRQKGSSKQQRHEQIVGGFGVRGANQLQDKHVLLIDDVVSTGATINEAARMLKEAGARRISVAVAAHNR